MDVSFGHVTGDDGKLEGLREIDPKNFGIVVGVAVHRLGVNFDVIQARYRHALQKIFDVCVTALSSIRVGLFVKREVLIVEYAFVRPGEFFVLPKIVGEVPFLWLELRLTETGLDQSTGGPEVLIEQKTGRHQRGTDIVRVAIDTVSGKVRGQP